MDLKRWLHRLNVRFRWIERKKRRVSYAPQHSGEQHTCQHCGTQFQGNYCPQCGKVAEWKRFTFKRLCLNFLDIWGLGNRPMIRTIRDLFWRPGYMIRDYLNGHYLSYFPPFKMLAVLTIFIIFLAWCFNIQKPISDNLILSSELDASGKQIMTFITDAFNFLKEHLLYSILLLNVLLVFYTWLIFKKKSDLNLVETFFSQIYINCQFHIITIVMMLLTQSMPSLSIYPYMVPDLLAYIVLIYDYKQLYGMKTWPIMWRIVVITILLVATYVFLAVLIVVLAVAISKLNII